MVTGLTQSLMFPLVRDLILSMSCMLMRRYHTGNMDHQGSTHKYHEISVVLNSTTKVDMITLVHSLTLFVCSLFCPFFSPYKVKVLPTHDASKVRASGPGLNTTGVPASLPVEFTIDAKDAGEGLLAVQITVSTTTINRCVATSATQLIKVLGLTGCV